MIFKDNGERAVEDIEVQVVQYQPDHLLGNSLTTVIVGSYLHANLTIHDNLTVWPGTIISCDIKRVSHFCVDIGGVPYDGRIVTVLVTVSVPLTIVYYLLATAGIVMTIACCVFNFTFRKTK